MLTNFETFISNYTEPVRTNAFLTRELILGMYKEVEEVVDESARVVGFMLGAGYNNTLCTMIPSKKTLKIGFYKGSLLNDPQLMLRGTGKVHRYLQIDDFNIQQDYLRFLLQEAFKMWKKC